MTLTNCKVTLMLWKRTFLRPIGLVCGKPKKKGKKKSKSSNQFSIIIMLSFFVASLFSATSAQLYIIVWEVSGGQHKKYIRATTSVSFSLTSWGEKFPEIGFNRKLYVWHKNTCLKLLPPPTCLRSPVTKSSLRRGSYFKIFWSLALWEFYCYLWR